MLINFDFRKNAGHVGAIDTLEFEILVKMRNKSINGSIFLSVVLFFDRIPLATEFLYKNFAVVEFYRVNIEKGALEY